MISEAMRKQSIWSLWTCQIKLRVHIILADGLVEWKGHNFCGGICGWRVYLYESAEGCLFCNHDAFDVEGIEKYFGINIMDELSKVGNVDGI